VRPGRLPGVGGRCNEKAAQHLTGVSSVTLLYTAHLEGDLRVLPRLFTLIQQERRAAEA